MYQLIIFDWDGTLMDSAAKIANCVIAAAEDVNLPPPSNQAARSIIGLGLIEAMRTLYPEQQAAKHEQLVDAYKHNFLHKNHTEQGLFAGVREGLTALRETGVELAVATGKSRAGLQRVLTDLDMHELFLVSRCADETRSKPHPQMLLEILDFTGLNASDCLMVGDTTYDMQMAAAANMHGLGVSYGVHPQAELERSGARAIVHSAAELFSWLQAGNIRAAYSG